MAMDNNEKTLYFKEKPLVRTGNTLYYGDPAEPYIAMLQITETETGELMELPSTIAVQIISTDEELPILQRIKKNTVQDNLYDGIKIASIWLDRILRDEKAFDNDGE